MSAQEHLKWESIKAAFGTTDQIVYCLPKCLECGALVEVEDREKHFDWHASVAEIARLRASNANLRKRLFGDEREPCPQDDRFRESCLACLAILAAKEKTAAEAAEGRSE